MPIARSALTLQPPPSDHPLTLVENMMQKGCLSSRRAPRSKVKMHVCPIGLLAGAPSDPIVRAWPGCSRKSSSCQVPKIRRRCTQVSANMCSFYPAAVQLHTSHYQHYQSITGITICYPSHCNYSAPSTECYQPLHATSHYCGQGTVVSRSQLWLLNAYISNC